MDIRQIAEMNGTIAEKCDELGELLGLAHPVSEEVLYSAIYEESYAHNLLICRNYPAMLEHLLANPPLVPEEKRLEQLDQHSQMELVQKMGEAVVKWGKTGFSRVDEEIFEKRMHACMNCPNLQDPPENLVYKLAALTASNKKICSLCGCLISRKTRLPSESCPAPDPLQPTLTRWGDPIPVTNRKG